MQKHKSIGKFQMKWQSISSVLLLFLSQPLFSQGLSNSIDVEFISSLDGTTQHYVVRLPLDYTPANTYSVLIALHGRAGDRWQFAEGTLNEAVAARDVAAERHMILVCPDYRAPASWMGPAAEADMIQIIEKVKVDYHTSKVFLCGASMGGTSALTFAVLHPNLIDGIIAMNPAANLLEFERYQDEIQLSFGGSKIKIPAEYKKRSAEYWPEKIFVPVGITLGGQDTKIPPQSAQRFVAILEKLNKPVMLIYREEAGHGSSYEDSKAILDYVVAGLQINKNIGISELYSPGYGPLLIKYPGIPGAPSGGTLGIHQYVIGTQLYDRGVSICANGAFRVYVPVGATQFQGDIGLQGGGNVGTATIVIVDTRDSSHILWQSGLLLSKQDALPAAVDITGLESFDVIVDNYDGDGNNDSAIFGNARILAGGGSIYLDQAIKSPGCAAFLEGDLNGDCTVNLQDLGILTRRWMECGYPLQSLCQ